MIERIKEDLYSIEPFLDDDTYRLLFNTIKSGEHKRRPPSFAFDDWAEKEVRLPSGDIFLSSDFFNAQTNFNDKIIKVFYDIYKIDVYEEIGFGVSVFYTGEGMPLHWDGSNKNLKTPSGFPSRDYSTVFYPGSDFLGGEIHFVKLDIKIKPKDNMLLIFPSGEMYNHRVENVISGTRYMCANFWCKKD